MEKCEKGYGKHCFECELETREFDMVATGGGMDTKMLDEFGERQIAINCSSTQGYFVLQLTEDAIKEISRGKIEDLNKVDVTEVPELIKGKDVQEHLNSHGEKISVRVHQLCTIPPQFP